MVSHSQDFMNGVCTNIIHLHKNGLQYYRVGVALYRSIYSNTGLHIIIYIVTLFVCDVVIAFPG